MRMVFPNNMTGQFLGDLATEMNTFVESILGEEASATSSGCATSNGCAAYTPRMDIDETEAGYLLSVDLPGVRLEDVSIDMEDEQMVISGSRARSTHENVDHRRSERVFGEFRRVVKLPKLVDIDAISAALENGVLTVTLPKLIEKKTSRKIVISGGTSTPKVDTTGTSGDH